MPRRGFEFYCSGGCGGYTVILLDTEDERDIIFVCPSCKHEHYRGMKDGQITERRHSNKDESTYVHRIEPTLAAYSKTQKLKALESKGLLGEAWSRFATH